MLLYKFSYDCWQSMYILLQNNRLIKLLWIYMLLYYIKEKVTEKKCSVIFIWKALTWNAFLRVWNGNPLQYSCLRNPMDRGAWWATVHEVTELDTAERLSTQHGMQSDTFKILPWVPVSSIIWYFFSKLRTTVDKDSGQSTNFDKLDKDLIKLAKDSGQSTM